ncbi:hypothetical protein ACFOU0_09340 [Salinicoccus sesuvii]|uniref:DUF4179 domain-containing protein n=1 Tax=Salinicoccus sesuvii TaxID=868281 RepID=A0ABV7N593_9STAP
MNKIMFEKFNDAQAAEYDYVPLSVEEEDRILKRFKASIPEQRKNNKTPLRALIGVVLAAILFTGIFLSPVSNSIQANVFNAFENIHQSLKTFLGTGVEDYKNEINQVEVYEGLSIKLTDVAADSHSISFNFLLDFKAHDEQLNYLMFPRILELSVNGETLDIYSIAAGEAQGQVYQNIVTFYHDTNLENETDIDVDITISDPQIPGAMERGLEERIHHNYTFDLTLDPGSIYEDTKTIPLEGAPGNHNSPIRAESLSIHPFNAALKTEEIVNDDYNGIIAELTDQLGQTYVLSQNSDGIFRYYKSLSEGTIEELNEAKHVDLVFRRMSSNNPLSYQHNIEIEIPDNR